MIRSGLTGPGAPAALLTAPAALLTAIAALLLTSGCGKKAESARAEHPVAGIEESTLARSKLPGAGGVAAALRLSDSAAARRAREDSIARAAP
jgi:hypothetical protein